MTTTDNLRNELIGKLLTISNKDYLIALNKVIKGDDLKKVRLTKEQKLMLEMSEVDIKAGRTISHEKLNKLDREWLKQL